MGTLSRWYVFLAILALVSLSLALGWYIWSQSLVSVPQAGGTYTEGLAGSPLYLNPILSGYNQVDRDICSLVFDGLTTINAHGEAVPDLASSWEISEDGREYTFHLRDDVYWQDGAPFTVEDVLYTIRAIQDPEFPGSPELADLWRQVVVEPLGMFTVRFSLPQAYAPFLSYTDVGLLPVHLLGNVPAGELLSNPFNQAPIGTGSFGVAELTRDHIVLKPNPDGLGQQPMVDEVEFKFYPSYQAALQAYAQGEVLGISRVLPDDLESIWADETLDLYSAPLSAHVMVFTNMESTILEELEVRQALAYASDRQAIIDQVLKGQGVAANGPIVPFSWAYDPALTTYAHDPDLGRRLLHEAEWVEVPGEPVRRKGNLPLRFELLVGDNAEQIAVADVLIRQWREVGIIAIPKVVGMADLVNRYLRPRNYTAALFAWQDVPPDPDSYPLWHSTQTGTGGQNLALLRDAEIDEALEEGRTQTDAAIRKRWYDRFQQRFTAIVPSLMLYHPVYNYAISNRVRGVQIGPLLDPSDRFRTIHDWSVKTKRITETQRKLTPEP